MVSGGVGELGHLGVLRSTNNDKHEVSLRRFAQAGIVAVSRIECRCVIGACASYDDLDWLG